MSANILKIIQDACFNVMFIEDSHSYVNINTGKKYISTTTLIKKFEPKFNESFWSEFKAKQRGITKKEILKEWRYLKKYGITRGNICHNIMQHIIHNRIPDIKVTGIPKEEQEEIKRNFIQKGINFINDHRNYISIADELVMHDDEYMLAGMCDRIVMNENNEFILLDYKTDKAIEFQNKFNKFKEPLQDLDHCNFNKYTLQLNIYKYLFEKATGLKIHKMFIVWFLIDNDNYEKIEIPQTPNYVYNILEQRRVF